MRTFLGQPRPLLSGAAFAIHIHLPLFRFLVLSFPAPSPCPSDRSLSCSPPSKKPTGREGDRERANNASLRLSTLFRHLRAVTRLHLIESERLRSRERCHCLMQFRGKWPGTREWKLSRCWRFNHYFHEDGKVVEINPRAALDLVQLICN